MSHYSNLNKNGYKFSRKMDSMQRDANKAAVNALYNNKFTHGRIQFT